MFAGAVVALAPARLMVALLPADAPLSLVDPRGSLWTGYGTLIAGGQNLGRLNWRFEWFALLRLRPQYAWSLDWRTPAQRSLSGTVAVNFSSLNLACSGPVPAAQLQNWLRAYDLFIDGIFDLQIRDIGLSHAGAVQSMDGTIQWGGGSVRYTLSGQLNEAILPPITAHLNEGLPSHEAHAVAVPSVAAANPMHIVAYARDEHTPLLFATQLSNGYVKIAVTKLLTQLVGQPWPGADPEHAIVIEVEEKLF